MKALIAALLLAVASSSQQGGRVHVHVTPGMQVLVDDVAMGLTTPEEGGKVVKVAAGPHRVTLRTQDGRETSVKISVADGQTTDVNISPLGFRKLNRPAEDDNGVLRVTSIPADAMVDFHGVTRENHDGTELTFDAIPPGRYPLTVTHNGKTVHMDIDIPKSSIVTADVNFRASAIRIAETKARPRRMQVNEANDPLTRLNVPGHWKTAIRSALPATVFVLDAVAMQEGVTVLLRVPSDSMADALLYSLESSDAFTRVAYASRPHREQSGWTVGFSFYFAR